MNVFSRKNPKLSSSDRTSNVKAKNIYRHMLGVANNCTGSGANYTGTVRFDICGNVINFRNYELARSMAKGSALISDCNCNGMSEPGGPETWNANGTVFNGGELPTGGPLANGAQTMAYLSNSSGWIPDRLDNDGGAGATDAPGGTLDGSGVWIDPNNHLFGKYGDCEIDKFLTYVDLTGSAIDLKGNDTKKNYMYNYAPIGSGISTKAGIGRSLRPFYTLPSGITGACCNDSDKYSWKIAKIGAKAWADVALSSNGIKIFAPATNSFIFISEDSGVTWRQTATSTSWNSISASSDGTKLIANNGTVGGFQGILFNSLNMGDTWSAVPTPQAGGAFQQITSSNDGQYAIVARSPTSLSTNSIVVRTTNFGQSWSNVSNLSSSNAEWYSVASSGSGQIAYIGQRSNNIATPMYKSTNYGQNWSLIGSATGIPVSSSIKWYGIACSDDGSVVYAADNSTNQNGGRIYRSGDSGANWVVCPGSQQKNWTAISCSADGKSIIACSGPTAGQVWTSDNFGETWTLNNLPGSIGYWRGVAISADGKRKSAVDAGSLPGPSGGRLYVFNEFNASYYQ